LELFLFLVALDPVTNGWQIIKPLYEVSKKNGKEND